MITLVFKALLQLSAHLGILELPRLSNQPTIFDLYFADGRRGCALVVQLGLVENIKVPHYRFP